MKCSLVSIARSSGAGGEEVGRLVAAGLGFRYLDNEIIIWAAEKAGVSPKMIADAEKTKPLIVRVLESLGQTNLAGAEGGYALQPLSAAPTASQSDYGGLIEKVIQEAAAEGRSVFVGHGAGVALQAETDALRVFITGTPELRALKFARDTLSDAGKARKAIDTSDQQRREFLKRLYGVNDEAPHLYDLVINTDHISIEEAANLVLQAAK